MYNGLAHMASMFVHYFELYQPASFASAEQFLQVSELERYVGCGQWVDDDDMSPHSKPLR